MLNVHHSARVTRHGRWPIGGWFRTFLTAKNVFPSPYYQEGLRQLWFFSEILPFQWGHIVCVCKNGIMDKVINPEAKTETSIITSKFWSQVWRLARPIWLHTVEVLQVFVCVTVESLRAVGALPMSSILLLDHVVVVVVVIDMQWFRLAIGLIAIHLLIRSVLEPGWAFSIENLFFCPSA